MGWSSGNEIFDPIAAGTTTIDHPTRLKLLTNLIDLLQEQDWDTEDESLDQFRHDLTVAAAFYLNGVGVTLDTDERGEIRYGLSNFGAMDPTQMEPGWRLSCATHGRLGMAEFTAEAHDGLLTTWVQHDAAEHGGTGSMNAVKHHMIGNILHIGPTRLPPYTPPDWNTVTLISDGGGFTLPPVDLITEPLHDSSDEDDYDAAYATGTPVTVITPATIALLTDVARAARDYIRGGNTHGVGTAASRLVHAVNALPEDTFTE